MIFIKKIAAQKLRDKILDCEKRFSDSKRERNRNGEVFKCVNVVLLSESMALVTFEKSGGKHSSCWFFFVKDYWIYFFPTDSHELGVFNYFINKYRLFLEGFNFDKNFKVEKVSLDG